jgi:hypothetical protein
MVEFHGVSPVVKTTEYGPKTAPSTRFPAPQRNRKTAEQTGT